MSAAQLLLRAISAFALSTSMVVVAQAPSPAAPAAAPAGAPSASSHGLKPDEVKNIHVNSKVATHNAKVAQASLEHAQNAFQKTKTNIRKITEAHATMEKVASNIKYIYPKAKGDASEEEVVPTSEQPARAGAYQSPVLMLFVGLMFAVVA